VTPRRVPGALARFHRSTAVGQMVDFDLPPEPYPGWHADVVEGGGFEPAGPGRLRRARTLADTVGPRMQLLLVGLNPSLYAADAGVGFARPGNRFWPAALAAGIVTRDRDPAHALAAHRIGMTDLVKRATATAAELSVEEYAAGAARLERLVAWWRPAGVCFVGLAGYRAAVDRRAVAGWQAAAFAGRPAYVMPNPSGLNAHVDVAGIAAHLRAAASAD
jgi:TDG/mug DNA glycosylase family protein